MSIRLQVLTGHLQDSKCFSNEMSKGPITTHVLDTALGKPAAGVPITISYMPQESKVWTQMGSGVTNEDGRCGNLLTLAELRAGIYRVHFDTSAYFLSVGNFEPFYPYVDIVFNLRNTSQHYHIPLLLSPYSYSTYRGS